MARADVERIVREVAGKYAFRDPELLLATVHQESGFDPQAIGDSGNSRGIFQENVRGRGANLAPEQSFDPYASTERAIREFQRFDRPGQTRGQWAAAAQRPADAAGYARNIDAWLGSSQTGRVPAAPTAAPGDAPAWVRDLTGQESLGTGALRDTGYRHGRDEGPGVTPIGAATPAPEGAPPWARELLATGAVGAAGGSPGASAGYSGPPQTDEVWPVAGQRWGRVNNPFGAGQSRAAGTTVELPSSNVGADLTARYGDAVVAPVSGTVVETYDAPDERDRNANHGWGGMTLLRGDNGYFYRLSHARPGSIAARPGQRVAQGQRLQEVGLSGNTTGAHLDAEKFARPGQFEDIAAGAGGRSGGTVAGALGAPTGGPLPAWVRELMGAT